MGVRVLIGCFFYFSLQILKKIEHEGQTKRPKTAKVPFTKDEIESLREGIS